MQYLKSLLGLAVLTLAPIAALSGWQLAKAQYNQRSLVAINFSDGPLQNTQRQTKWKSRCETCMPDRITGLIALIPGHDVAKTASTEPTFFFYIPENTAEFAELVVVDEEGNLIYLNTFEISNTHGIVKVNLPKHAGFETGNQYIWQFALVCSIDDRAADMFVQGSLEIVELKPDLSRKLDRASALERAQLYADVGIWNETITTVAALRNSHPREWEELLDSVGLGEISSEPFAPCCD